MIRLNHVLLMMLLISAGLVFSTNAQNKVQHSKMKSEIHQTKKVALEGYSPVAYQEMHKAVKGIPAYSSTYKGKTYYFVTAKGKNMFDKDPKKYLPAYGSYCAFGMSMGKKVSANPKLFTVYKGKTYLFHNKKVKKMFDKSPAKYVKKDNKEYAKMNKK